MRFQNWDVLIFPANDATPIQEFTTEFCNIPDPDHAFLNKMSVEDPHTPGKGNPKVLPTVSTYIPMLTPGTPFQISIHSWFTPEVTSNLDPGSQAMIEARIFIDGVPITYVVCPASAGWPMVVDSYPINSAYGTRKRNLSFPAFNQDSLNQWANGDTELGRIKIIISEGVAGGAVENGEVSYMRLKNLVCFYYRYAPQEFLESVGIYYPTTRKYDNSLARWFPISVPSHHLSGGSALSGSAFGSPAHSHSPKRRPVTTGVVPPAFDLDLATPSLEKSTYPDLKPANIARTISDPFATKADDEHTGKYPTKSTVTVMADDLAKAKKQIEVAEDHTGEPMHSPVQTPLSTGTPILEPTMVPARMRADSVKSEHLTSSFKLEYTEQASDGVDPSISKTSMKIGLIAESQKQMQSAVMGHSAAAGEDMKDMSKFDCGRSTLPLVELDNIL